jgi:hypothetical protein
MLADAPKTLNFGVEETACGNRIESSNLSRSASPTSLGARGIPTPNGAQWDAQTVLRMINRLSLAQGLTAA